MNLFLDQVSFYGNLGEAFATRQVAGVGLTIVAMDLMSDAA